MKQEQIDLLQKSLDLKYELLHSYANKISQIEKEKNRIIKEVEELKDKIKKEENIKIYRIIPLYSSYIYVELFKNEEQGDKYGNHLFYEDMDEEFKSLIPEYLFSQTFLQPDLEYLYWRSPLGKFIKRKINDLF